MMVMYSPLAKGLCAAAGETAARGRQARQAAGGAWAGPGLGGYHHVQSGLQRGDRLYTYSGHAVGDHRRATHVQQHPYCILPQSLSTLQGRC